MCHVPEGNPTNSAPPVRCWLSAAHRGAWRTIVSATGVNQGSEADDGIVAGVYGGTEKIAAKTGFFDAYRRSQIYVTQRRPDHRMQGAKRGANAGRR
jgi:hypothetical protein